MKEVEEDLPLVDLVDETPRRVKSKVEEADDLTVVEEGAVARALKKLQSTSSYVFGQASSVDFQHVQLEGKRVQGCQSSVVCAAPEAASQEVGEESVEEVEEDLSSFGLVDETPRRVRCKADIVGDLSVVEKGTVARTLKKLQSTGSYVFRQTSSIAS